MKSYRSIVVAAAWISSVVIAGCGAGGAGIAAEGPLAEPYATSSEVTETKNTVPEPTGEPQQRIAYSAQQVWTFLATSAGNNSGATSLAEAVEGSELVVIGRMTELSRGDGYGDQESVGWYAVATIDVVEVLAGQGAVSAGSVLQVPFVVVIGPPGTPYPDREFEDLRASMPTEPALLFLTSWATAWGRIGADVPDWLEPLNRIDLYRTIGADGALVVKDGRVTFGRAAADTPKWVEALQGVSVDAARDLVHGVRR